jgi:FtsZ-interacting cell division protein YlmF
LFLSVLFTPFSYSHLTPLSLSFFPQTDCLFNDHSFSNKFQSFLRVFNLQGTLPKIPKEEEDLSFFEEEEEEEVKEKEKEREREREEEEREGFHQGKRGRKEEEEEEDLEEEELFGSTGESPALKRRKYE